MKSFKQLYPNLVRDLTYLQDVYADAWQVYRRRSDMRLNSCKPIIALKVAS